PGVLDVDEARALLVGLHTADVLGGGGEGGAQLRRGEVDALLLRGGQQQRGGAGGLRGGHRGALEHAVAGREAVAGLGDRGARGPGLDGVDRGAGGDQRRREAAVLTRTTRGEGHHVVPGAYLGAVVGGPGLLGDGRADGDDLVRQGGVADGVGAGSGVARGDD